MAFITLIHALCQQTFGLSLPRNCAFLANQQIAVVLLDLESPGGLERATLIQFRPSQPSYGSTLRLRLSDLGPISTPCDGFCVRSFSVRSACS